MNIEETIQVWAEKRGYQAAAGGVSLLKEVRSSLEKRRDKREIDNAFFRDYLDNFSYLEGSRLKNPQSILIVAVPRPAHILSFSLANKTIETILPPTYVGYRKFFEDVRGDLEAALSAHNCHLEILSAPLKSVANILWLLSYGRNNIGYIEGLGSFFQLVGLLSDKRVGAISRPMGPSQKLLARCRECRICAKACPTGAIDKDRILLHAEKCYTLFSEAPEPIPEDLKPPSPRCLIGCIRCQKVCPENKGLLHYEEAAVSFDSEETLTFLGEEQESGQAMERAKAKFRKLGMTEDMPIFMRNFKRMVDSGHLPMPKGNRNKSQ
jgi:epoxyqueuosine reductase